MAEPSDIEDQIAANAAAAKSVSVDGTQTVEHDLGDQIEADKYVAANRAKSRRGVGVIFRKIIPHGSVS